MSAARAPLPRWVDIVLIPIINIAMALFVSGLIILAIGENPIEAVGTMLQGAVGYDGGIRFFSRHRAHIYRPRARFPGIAAIDTGDDGDSDLCGSQQVQLRSITRERTLAVRDGRHPQKESQIAGRNQDQSPIDA